MEVVEKEKETIKEVPAGYYHDKYGCYDDGYGYGRYSRYGTPFASKGVAGTGLGLGIAGTALGLLALKAERRCCADNKIVNYVNSNFYPISVADVTTGTAVTQRTLSNPLCGCCCGN